MNITTIGKGNIGGGLARLWEAAGHRVTTLGHERVRPSCLYAADEEAREVTERLIRDAGYDPVSIGGIENARALEDFVPGVLGKIELGRTFYRFAPPGEL